MTVIVSGALIKGTADNRGNRVEEDEERNSSVKEW